MAIKKSTNKKAFEILSKKGQAIIKDAKSLIKTLEERGKDSSRLGIKLMDECFCYINHVEGLLEILSKQQDKEGKKVANLYLRKFEGIELALAKVCGKVETLF